jgi:hypothetical protein
MNAARERVAAVRGDGLLAAKPAAELGADEPRGAGDQVLSRKVVVPFFPAGLPARCHAFGHVPNTM